MATAVTIPDLGDDPGGAVLIRFLVEPGADVKPGDPLYELDTDKVTQEVEAEAEGVLLQVVAEQGQSTRPARRSPGSATPASRSELRRGSTTIHPISEAIPRSEFLWSVMSPSWAAGPGDTRPPSARPSWAPTSY